MDQPQHRAGRVRPHDDRLRIRNRVIQTEAAGKIHRAAVVAGDLVVVQVGGREAGGRDLIVEQAQAAAVDPELLEPGAIFDRVRSGGREHGAGIAEQREVVCIVARHATTALLQVVDQEAQVEDVGLVRKDVVFESPLEAEDVVERDRTGADHAHSRARLAEADVNDEGAPRLAPLLVSCEVLTRRRGGARWYGGRCGGSFAPSWALRPALPAARLRARAGWRPVRWS